MDTFETSGLVFNDGPHEYWLGGKKLISVTTLLQLEGALPGLEFVDPWFAERGKMIHLATELYDKGESSIEERMKGYEEQIKGCLESWKRYRESLKYQFQPEHIELKLADEVYGYAGTIDRLPLLDIKGGVYKKADLAQLGAYYGLCQANKIDRDIYMGPEARRVVYLNEDGSFPVVDQYTVRELISARDSFLAALAWNRFKNTK